ncbi:hypothetical protein MG293_017043 [Ovis ammon polii]|uniref:Uncharacterized protein n=1 Tax=Ovis ammon polii TaxID=230172 RepID=A0AAD4TUM5_OVIAM|nr:hypothetical protein MG293_017043 [Ovis ammon polii]
MAVKATRSGHGSACQSCKLRLAGVLGSRQTCGQIDNAAARVPRTPPVPAQNKKTGGQRLHQILIITQTHTDDWDINVSSSAFRSSDGSHDRNSTVPQACNFMSGCASHISYEHKELLEFSVSTMNTFIINKRYSPRPARDPCRSPGFCSDLPDLGEGLRDGARVSLSLRAVTACGVDVALFQKACSVIRLRGPG